MKYRDLEFKSIGESAGATAFPPHSKGGREARGSGEERGAALTRGGVWVRGESV